MKTFQRQFLLGKRKKGMMIFTDLDGSLLDHADYSYESALPALEKIRSGNVPLVMCTSKTRKEVEPLMAELRLREPFIVENGGGVYFPERYRKFRIEKGTVEEGMTRIGLGAPYEAIRAFVKETGGRYGVRGFGDMSVRELAELTGLPAEKAALARMREFSEPFVMDGEGKYSEFEQAAREAGFDITSGGRFGCLVGNRQDKGAAVRLVQEIFEGNLGYRCVSVGIGDSLNDLPMLQAVDVQILIPHPDGRCEDAALPNLIRATMPGSRGWNQVVHAFLSNLEKFA
jgi:mannosyl-3-phosphoglycerate phosphatase